MHFSIDKYLKYRKCFYRVSKKKLLCGLIILGQYLERIVRDISVLFVIVMIDIIISLLRWMSHNSITNEILNLFAIVISFNK